MAKIVVLVKAAAATAATLQKKHYTKPNIRADDGNGCEKRMWKNDGAAGEEDEIENQRHLHLFFQAEIYVTFWTNEQSISLANSQLQMIKMDTIFCTTHTHTSLSCVKHNQQIG